jgi:hypothetical protein
MLDPQSHPADGIATKSAAEADETAPTKVMMIKAVRATIMDRIARSGKNLVKPKLGRLGVDSVAELPDKPLRTG